MSDKGTASQRRSTGLLPAGIIIAVLIAVAAFMTLRGGNPLDQAKVTAVVTPASPDASQEPETSGDPEPLPADTPAETGARETPPPEETAAEEETAAAPTVDEVRVDGDGTAVIAGRGVPGSQVDVLLDGEVVTSAQVDRSGAFAALTDIPESDTARSLTLRSGEGDATIASREEIILAPVKSARPEADDKAVEDVAAGDPVADAQFGEVVADAGEAVEESATADAQNAGTVTAIPTETETPGGTAADTTLAQALPEGAEGAPQADATQEPQTSAEVQAAPTENVTEQQATQPSQETSGLETEDGPAQVDPAAPPKADEEENRQIAVLRSDDQGVTLVQPEAPLPDSVVLDTIGYNDAGVVQLAGRASGAATEVRVYLDNQPVARLDVSAQGAWRGAVPGVAPGVYQLRIDAVTPEGRVASRIETPFKREAPAVLAAAAEESGDEGPVRAVTVQAGDTLWAIARERYGEGLLYVQVFEANRNAIRDPDLIYPGQVFDLPVE